MSSRVSGRQGKQCRAALALVAIWTLVVGYTYEVAGQAPIPARELQSVLTPDPGGDLFPLVAELRRHSPGTPLDALVLEYYERRDYKPAWLDPAGRTAASLLLMRTAAAHREGLDPAAYAAEDLSSRLRGTSDRAEALIVDLEITRTLLAYIVHVALGREATEDRAASNRDFDVIAALEALRHEPGRFDIVEVLAPRHPEYARLREALAAYREIAHHGGWPQQKADLLLRPGDTAPGDVLTSLRQRLMIAGDLRAGAERRSEDRYDRDTADAVRLFQTRHGLLVDGIVGPETVAAMNVPPGRRTQQIALNMDRWRRLPDSLGDAQVRVNIPEFRLRYLENGEQTLAMRVVVGRAGTQTPVFSDRIRYVQFRPYWNVPASIVREELVPKAMADPVYLQNHGYEVLAGWKRDADLVDISSIDWEAERFKYRIRQRPGPANALGLVKFMFPNRYSVYVHDTPAKSLFARHSRAFSHGCVRVEHPAMLATALLRRQAKEWTMERVHSAMHHGPRMAVPLEEPVGVHLLYMTSWVGADGTVQFRRDVYGRDARALERFHTPPRMINATR